MEVREACASYAVLAGQREPKGYKQTEVGLIPEDWEVSPLGAFISSLEAGVSVNSVDKEKDVYAHDESVLKTSCVLGGRFLPEENKKILPRDIHRAKANPRKDSIIISRMNTPALVGESGYIARDYPNLFLPDRLWMTRHNVQKPPCVRWLAYILAFKSFNRVIKESATGTSGSMKNISKGALLGIQVPLPTKAEQEAIAEALSDADALITSLEQLLAKKRQLKQGAMQELLTGKKRLPGFGGEWEVNRVAQLGEIATGGTPRTDVKEYWGEGYPWVTPTDISSHRDMFTSQRTLTQKGLNSIRVLPPNTVLVTCIASIGKNAILKSQGGCNQQINAVIPSDKNSAEFLYYLFEASKQYLLANAGTTATSIISKASFGEMTFIVPQLPEQTAIAAILSDMGAEITALEEKLAKARDIKQGMMQELLTGRIRLV